MSAHTFVTLLGLGVPIFVLLCGAAALFSQRKTISSLLQLLGASGLMVVLLTHIAEAFELLSWMHWGSEHSAGHYIDLGGAILGLILFPIGYLIHALGFRSPG